MENSVREISTARVDDIMLGPAAAQLEGMSAESAVETAIINIPFSAL